MKETDDIVRKKGDLIGRVNKVLVEFSKAPDSVVGGLFNSKCAHLYGCEAWDQGDPCVNRFYATWNRSVRKLYGLPNTRADWGIGGHAQILATPHTGSYYFTPGYMYMFLYDTLKRLLH
jgi:hypothetical protein